MTAKAVAHRAPMRKANCANVIARCMQSRGGWRSKQKALDTLFKIGVANLNEQRRQKKLLAAPVCGPPTRHSGASTKHFKLKARPTGCTGETKQQGNEECEPRNPDSQECGGISGPQVETVKPVYGPDDDGPPSVHYACTIASGPGVV